MSFLYNFLSTRLPNFSRERDELEKTEIYRAINWKKSVIAGSYALFQFTGATNWKPDDVDIMIACLSKQEFEMEAEKFEIKSKAKLTKFSWFDDKNKAPVPSDAELFHDKVLGSRTYQMDNFDKKVQLICLLQSNPQESVTDILTETTDIPSCVSYTVDITSGKKMFHIPEKGREILLTGKGNKNDICKSRLEKYLKRGYSFV